MRKFILSILVAMFAIVANSKAIYYPIYIGSVEIYHNDSLVVDKTIFNSSTLNIEMYQQNCSIVLETPNIIPFIKESISMRRSSNLMAIAGVMNAAASIGSATKGMTSKYNASLYLANSYFFASKAYLDFELAARFKELSNNSLVIPTTCNVLNYSNKILRGNIIVKPNEKQSLAHTNYYDEWRFSDNENNVYCVRLMAVVIRDDGYISREKEVAFVKPTKEEKKNGHKKEYKRIDLNTYETEWVSNKDEEFLYIKDEYGWDKGYN